MSWEEELENYIDKDTVILGIGSDLKSDDRVGIYITEEISKIGKYEVIVAGPTPEHWIGFVVNRGYKKLLIIDAVISGGNPGEIQVLDINEISERFGLTHSSSLHLFSDFLFKEGKIKSIKILAIEPKSVDIGTELSEDVKKVAEKIIKFFESYNM
jgi:hydrogenase maturation protease